MTVFKGYIYIIKQNLPLLIMYFCIFMGVSIGVQKANGDKPVISFETERLTVGVIDEDGSALAEGLIDYIGQEHDIVAMEKDEAVIQNELFYRNVAYVLTIPENFAARSLEQGEKLQTTKIPDSSSAFYIDQRVDDYLNGVNVYKSSGYSVKEAIDLTLEQGTLETEVTIHDMTGNSGQIPGYIYMLVYHPYLYITVICFAISTVMVVFRDREIKRRMQSSAVSLRRQNVEGLLAFAVVALIFLGLCLLLITVMYPGFWSDIHLGYLIFNMVSLLLVTLSIAYVVGTVAKNAQIVNNIVNTISLGMCFLGGVFVSLDLLGSSVKKVSQFLPVYWYEMNLEILSGYGKLTDALKMDLFKGYGIQLAFAAACVAVALVISKYRVQER